MPNSYTIQLSPAAAAMVRRAMQANDVDRHKAVNEIIISWARTDEVMAQWLQEYVTDAVNAERLMNRHVDTAALARELTDYQEGNND